ncbi:MAG: DUF4860 domain-containing protein [Lachnospiraceae bacterium]|nr:DUF4860 domain-containing protein [Lachnospiraceae bacterium]
MKSSNKSHSVGIVFSMSLICLFTILSALLIYMGYESYKGIIDNREYNKNTRVALSYLTGKVRTADSTKGVNVSERNGYEVLSISEGDCETLIYYYKNSIYEVYMAKGDDFLPEFGERVAKVKSYKAIVNDNVVTFEITLDSGEELSADVALRK